MNSTKPPRVKFVVLTSPRSGSTWLVSLLNQMEHASAYGELFLPRKRSGKWDQQFAYPRFAEIKHKGRFSRPIEVFRYLDELYRKPGVVGFKLMYSQLRRYPEILVYLLIKRVRVVHLVRNNQLDILISRAIKRKVQRAHRLATEAPLEGIQVELDPHALLHKLKIKGSKVRRGKILIQLSGLRYTDISYEDLHKNEGAFQALCNFLSINSGEKMPESVFQKMRRESRDQVLKNYSEVRKTLEEAGYAAYLD